MKKLLLTLLLAIVLSVIGSAGFVVANTASDDGCAEEYCITISPNTLVLNSESQVVTVHSNIPYVSVDTVSLTLDGISATYTKADTCGDLVVKFESGDIKDIVKPGEVTLTLSGKLKDNSSFSASDTITVIEGKVKE